jgi:monoamine oxidase
MSNSFDVIVIGAGAAGLMAALEMALTGKSVGIIEAKKRVGGRIYTIQDDPQFELPVEAGAEFVHGNLELTKMLLDKASIEISKLKGDFWQSEDGEIKEQEDFIKDYDDLEKKFKELKKDEPVANFINKHLQGDEYEELRFSLKNYVEGYYAADTHQASTYALKEELAGGDESQYRIEGGYGELINYLRKSCEEKGVKLFLSQPVAEIIWKKNEVEVVSSSERYFAHRVLITVPLGVLKSGQIKFSPQLTSKSGAIDQLGFGSVIKIVLQFSEGFWKHPELTQEKDLSKMAFLFSNQKVPTWWTQYPEDVNIITGWLGGPNADKMKDLSNEEVVEKALEALSTIFDFNKDQLKQKLIKSICFNWINDPFTCGGYSYEVVNGAQYISELKTPVEKTVYFAGEALHGGPQIGTVEGALASGREVAQLLIASF